MDEDTALSSAPMMMQRVCQDKKADLEKATTKKRCLSLFECLIE